MSKKMTPCEKLGYKVGDEFEVLTDGDGFEIGSIVELWCDDDSICPVFRGKGCDGRYLETYLNACQPESGVVVLDVKKVDEIKKLKPAKQALADAIYQNGGWTHGAEYAAQDKCAQVTMFRSKPIHHGNAWLDDEGFDDVGGFGCDKIQNWHQCILSRGEYFIAYPEQVKVEVKNETKHKVGVEMESESEVTIKVSDWHKNGELPPVCEVCEAYIDYPPQWIETEIVAHKDGFAIGWCKSVMKGCHGDKAHEFRPIRTEREKAIDEMVDCLSSRWANCEEIAEHLYESGYRKEVK